MNKFKTVALAALYIALIAESIWLAQQLLISQTSVSDLIRPLVFTTTFLFVALTRGNNRWIAMAGRIVIGVAFLLALWGRFDDFAGFTRYAGVVLSFMPRSVVPALAVLATICEVILCTAMLLGIKVRLAAAGSGVLLFMFATAMTISGLTQFDWAVYLLSAGSWALACVDASAFSFDSVFKKKETPEWKSTVETP